jgi:hypothetical protein
MESANKNSLEPLIGEQMLFGISFTNHPVLAKLAGVDSIGVWLEGRDILKEVEKKATRQEMAPVPGEVFNHTSIFVPFQHLEWIAS